MDGNLGKTASNTVVMLLHWMRETVSSVVRAASCSAVLHAALCATLQPINIPNIPLSSPPPMPLLLLPQKLLYPAAPYPLLPPVLIKKWSWQVLETQARDTRAAGTINELWPDNSWVFLDQINLHFSFSPNIYTSTAAVKFKLTGLGCF